MSAKKEANLKKLSKTAVLANFVKKNNGKWGHAEWEALCAKIAEKYSPIDLDQVGVLLEKKKAAYWAKK